MKTAVYTTQLQNLRNPIIVFLAFLLVMIPGFIGMCQQQGVLSSPAAWFIPDFCPKEFLPSLLMKESIMSLLLVMISFESIYQARSFLVFNKLERKLLPYFQRQWRLIVPFLASTVIYTTLKITSLYLEETLVFDEFLIKVMVSDLAKIAVLTFIVVNIKYVHSLWNVKKKRTISTISGHRKGIETLLYIEDVMCFEKIDRYYYALINDMEYKIELNLTELEEIIPNNAFQRISRKAIINIAFVHECAYWENDKYVLKLKNGKEFHLTRVRMKSLKKRLATYPAV